MALEARSQQVASLGTALASSKWVSLGDHDRDDLKVNMPYYGAS